MTLWRNTKLQGHEKNQRYPEVGEGGVSRWSTEDFQGSKTSLNDNTGYTQSLSRVGLFVAPWTEANQAPLSMGFPRKENWSG